MSQASPTIVDDRTVRSLSPMFWVLSLIVHGGLLFLVANSAGDWFAMPGGNAGDGPSETFNEVGVVVKNANSNREGPGEENAPNQDAEAQPVADRGPAGAPESDVPNEAPVPLELPGRDRPGIGPGSLQPSSVGVPNDIGEFVRNGGTREGGGITGLRAGETRFFGIKDKGARIVYLIDISGSMAGKKLRAARSQLLASLETLLPSQQFQVLFYNQGVYPLRLAGAGRQNVYRATDINKTKTRQALASIRADLGTNREQALMAGLGYGPDIVYFLTDGDAVELDRRRRNRIRERNRDEARIHCIEFGEGPAPTVRTPLGRLALENGGVYRYQNVAQWDR